MANFGFPAMGGDGGGGGGGDAADDCWEVGVGVETVSPSNSGGVSTSTPRGVAVVVVLVVLLLLVTLIPTAALCHPVRSSAVLHTRRNMYCGVLESFVDCFFLGGRFL